MTVEVCRIYVNGDIDIEQSACALADLQGYVGGMIEGVYGDDWVMWLDEEGKAKQKLPNVVATVLAREIGLDPNDIVVGNVVLVGMGMDGETAPVPAEQVARAQTMQTALREVAARLAKGMSLDG